MKTVAFNSKLSKKINREIVLKMLYSYKPISRVDIAGKTGLTTASITKIVNEFIKIGLVKEINKVKSNQGRRPVLLDIDKDSYLIVGISISSNKMVGVLTNLGAEIKKKVVLNESFINNPKVSSLVISLIKKLITEPEIDKTKLLGVGLGVPGPINAKKGEIYDKQINEAPPFNWKKVSLVEDIYKEIRIPIFAENNENVAAIGEAWFGNGTAYKNMVFISFGAGVGGGIILKNRIYKGEDDIVGEIGHTTVESKGPKCECGNFGCLELYSKNENILSKYKELSLKYPSSKLAKLNTKRIEDIYNYKDLSDPLFNGIMDYQASYLGIAAINLINILNPEVIIIGTNDIEDINLDILVEKITKIIRKRAYPVVRNKIKIMPSKLKAEAGLVGSISLVLKEFFDLDEYSIGK